MPSHDQPKDYYQINYDHNDEPHVSVFFSNIANEMENPQIYGMTWEQVQKTLHHHYKQLSKVYDDISDDWLQKTEDEYFLPPKSYQQKDLWIE